MANITLSKPQVEELIILLTEQRVFYKTEETDGRTKYAKAYATAKLAELRELIIALQNSIKDELTECELSYYRIIGQYEQEM